MTRREDERTRGRAGRHILGAPGPAGIYSLQMRRLSVRITRSLTAFFAVWCLGCSSLNVLLDRLTGGSDTTVASCMSMGEQPDAVAGITIASHRADACGCDHCVAVQGPPAVIARASEPIPHAIVRVVAFPPSVGRTPLHPPPIA